MISLVDPAGNLIGDTELNFVTLQKSTDVATDILVYLLRSVVDAFEFSLANFAITGTTASEMFPLLWKVIRICELTH